MSLIYPALEYYINREKDEAEKEEERNNFFRKWNIYCIDWLERNVVIVMLSKGYSFDFIYHGDLREVFRAYRSLTIKSLIDAAEQWYSYGLREIERKCDEQIETGDKKHTHRDRTDKEKEALRQELRSKKFIKSKKEIEL